MGKKPYPPEIKEQVVRLRAAGKTYAQIREQFPIPKSTLSVWLGEAYPLFDRKTQLEHLKKVRLLAANTLRNRRLERERLIAEHARASLEALPVENKVVQKAMIAMLYWAEGAKTEGSLPTFANTDPKLAKLYITLLRATFPIDERKFRVRLHLHWYHDKEQSLRFWSDLLAIPASQFGKLYIKKRSSKKRFRKNFSGICFIKYNDISVRKELMELSYGIYAKVAEPLTPSSFNG